MSRSRSPQAELLAAELTRMRLDAGLTIRELEKRSGIPSGTLGGYFAGRHLPPASRPEVLESILEACQVPEDERPRWHDWVRELHLGRRGPRVRQNPYRGLDAYRADDADVYFGRQAEVDRLVALVDDVVGSSLPLVCVVGPSGAGKTSLVQAGLVAQLQSREVPWRVQRVRVAGEGVLDLPDAADRPTAVIVDQLEEVFGTQDAEGSSPAPATLKRLSEILDWSQAAPDQQRLAVVILRADLYPYAARSPRLRSALQDRQVLVADLTPEALQEVVRGPGTVLGLSMEEGLVDLIVAEARVGAGQALPHLSYLLSRMYEESDQRALRVQDYRRLGGFDGAIQVAAEAAFEALEPHQQDRAKELILGMVAYHEGVGPVRRRLDPEQEDSHEILSHFTSRRLVTVNEGGYELSHESLLRSWPRLAGWIEQDRMRLVAHGQLSRAASQWDEEDRDEELLLRGTRLQSGVDVAGGSRLTTLERSYLEASQERADLQRDQEAARLRRTRAALAVMGVLTLIAALLLADTLRARAGADRARQAAEARQIAYYANQLGAGNLPLSALLSAAGQVRDDNVTSRSALVAATGQPLVSRHDIGLLPRRAAVWDDGDHAAVAGHHGEVALLSLTGDAPEVLTTLTPEDGVEAGTPGVAVNGDGSVLAVTDHTGRIVVRDATDPAAPTELGTIEVPEVATVLDLDERGTVLVAGTAEGTLRLWRAEEGSWRELDVPDLPEAAVYGIRISADGSHLAMVTGTGGLLVWTVGEEVQLLDEVGTGDAALFAVDFAPDLDRIAATGADRTVFVFELSDEGLELETSLAEFTTWVNDIRFSRDGSLLLAGSSNRLLKAWPLTDEEIPTQPSHQVELPGEITALREGPDGHWLIADNGPDLHTWSLRGGRLTDHQSIVFVSRFARETPMLLTSAGRLDGRVRLWDATDPYAPEQVAELRSPEGVGVPVGSSDISPDGRYALVGSVDGHVLVWDISDPSAAELVFHSQIGEDIVQGVSFSDDGSWAVTFTRDRGLQVLTLGDEVTGSEPMQLSFTALALDAGRDLFALTSTERGVELFGRDDPLARVGSVPSEGAASDIELTQDDAALLVASDRVVREIDLTDLAEPTEVATLTGANSSINAIDMTADGRRVAAASIDGTAWVWERNGSEWERWMAAQLPTPSVMSVGWHPTEPLLVAGGHRGVVALLTADVERAREQICATRGDDLRAEEWERALPDVSFTEPCGR
ncbi:helix-turn-helix domain-containing protein [Ornithinimicrobium sp. Y1847]|uniref:nSTAND1 domain-containing NTPase n=1 Tax=Ornithinimicrobium sp. Y1847 TaxID=3405419 RepID=UPI003B67BB3F